MIRCAILGASGLIGQQFIRMLANHPQIEITVLYSSHNSAGKSVEQIWELPFYNVPENVKSYIMQDITNIDPTLFDIAFSGLPASVADKVESYLREQGKGVFTNSSPHRMDNDVPILIPEINGNLISMAQEQKYDGFIIANANCSVTGASIYLGELEKISKINTAVISTYQAISGAGLTGVSALSISDNVIPYIQNEEEKIVAEAKKILGKLDGNTLIDNEIEIIANAARVNVIDGHTEAISCHLNDEIDDIVQKLSSIRSPLKNLYSAPEKHIQYQHGARPQPKIDRFNGTGPSEGMVITVGRSRVQKFWISSYILVHNTIRGGAGGSVLNAEYAIQSGLL